MKEWFVKQVVRGGCRYWWGPWNDKESAEMFAERIPGKTEVCYIDEHVKEFIDNCRNFIYRNQEGRTERERKRRLQRTWFISMKLRWI